MRKLYSISILFLPVVLSLLPACGGGAREGKVLAKVGDVYLYETDLAGLTSKGVSKADSVALVKHYTRNWIRKQILIQHATGETGPGQEEIERKTQQYKSDLLLSAFEQQYLAKNLDTAVTEKEVNAFYAANPSLFELRDYAVNVFYLKFNNDANGLDAVARDMRNCNSAADAAALESKYSPMAVNTYYEPGAWLFLDDLVREVPLEVDNKERFLKSTPFVELKTDEYIFLVRIFDYKLKNETSPVGIVHQKIKSLIRQKKSRDMIAALREDIITRYNKEHDVENYTK